MNSRFVINELKKYSSSTRAKSSARFFKTQRGQYGFGDEFWGVSVPNQRKVARLYANLSLVEIKKLLMSHVHEHRLTALIILVDQYSKSNLKEQDHIFNFYLKNLKYVNNWDLVDTTAHKIVGMHLLHKTNRNTLYKLVMSENIWERRVAIVSTLTFVSHDEYVDAVKLAGILISDNHDLIHKASGWVLREVGKKSKTTLLSFLKKYSHRMPRTMLRYSIEHFDKKTRAFWLKK